MFSDKVDSQEFLCDYFWYMLKTKPIETKNYFYYSIYFQDNILSWNIFFLL